MALQHGLFALLLYGRRAKVTRFDGIDLGQYRTIILRTICFS